MSILLETKDLGITFGGLKAVQSFDLKIEKGELYGLIGPNGAGKTTIFNMLTGVYKPTNGRVYLDGNEITGKTEIAINKKGIARTFQNIRLFGNMTVIENVMVGLNNQYNCDILTSMCRLPRYFRTESKMRARAMDLLSIFGLEEYADNFARNLPYGKQRKLEIARALGTNPKLLLLDEPAAGMNPAETKELMNTVKGVRDMFDITVLIIEHDIKFVSGLCENITVLNFGKTLAQGSADKVLSLPEVITAYLGE
ncbi:MAG: ABC transporter ATP-binding protein [Clostridia bacterium]